MRLFILLFLFTTSAHAQTVCGPQNYVVKIEPNYDCPSPQEDVLVPDLQAQPSVELLKGAVAPRDGVLLDKNRVLVLGLRIKALRHIRWIETVAAGQKLTAEVAYQQKIAKAQADLQTSQIESYKRQLIETQEALAREQKWYKSWTFGVVVGIVVTAAGGTALGYALRK
jgi:hypothetical protein